MAIMNFASLMTGNNSEPEKKVKLKMNDQKIHSMQELRKNFDTEVIMKKHRNGKLVKWLKQHYYEKEAAAVSLIRPDSKKCLKELCAALGVAYDPLSFSSEEEKEKLNKRKDAVSKFTKDDAILSRIDMVATNQAELADILDREKEDIDMPGKETEVIYLCNNTFAIPITLPNRKYIGIGDVVLENAFTKAQYEKAGIKVENIALSETEDPDTAAQAKLAAANYGYDDFSESHSTLANAYHDLLMKNYWIPFHTLPLDNSIVGKTYKSRSSCYNAAKGAIRKAYDIANGFFDTENETSLSREAAKYYGSGVESIFKDTLQGLQKLCVATNNQNAFDKITEYIDKCKRELKKTFDKELIESKDFYEMYHFDYFMEQVDIGEWDSSVAEEDDFLGQVLEAIFTDTKEYMISNLFTSISEMKNDLDDHAATFYKYAYQEYKQYVGKIEEQLEIIGQGLGDMKEGEKLKDYIVRMTASVQ